MMSEKELREKLGALAHLALNQLKREAECRTGTRGTPTAAERNKANDENAESIAIAIEIAIELVMDFHCIARAAEITNSDRI